MSKSIFQIFIFVIFCFNLQKSFAKERLIVTFSELPPLKIIRDGVYEGPYAEIIREISIKLDIQIKFIKCPLIRCLFLMKSGEADIIIGLRKNQTRSEYIQFITTPIRESQEKVFYLRKNAKNKIGKYEDLNEIGIIGTKTAAKYFVKFDKDETLSKYAVPYAEQIFLMLINKRIDTLIVTKDQGEYIASKLNINDQVERATYSYKDYRHSYMGMSKKSTHLHKLEELETALKEMSANGRLKSILHQYSF
jgi:polar amino acid transport system substrate-binding protein